MVDGEVEPSTGEDGVLRLDFWITRSLDRALAITYSAITRTYGFGIFCNTLFTLHSYVWLIHSEISTSIHGL